MKLSRFYLRVRKAIEDAVDIFAGLPGLAERRAADYATQAAKHPFRKYHVVLFSRGY